MGTDYSFLSRVKSLQLGHSATRLSDVNPPMCESLPRVHGEDATEGTGGHVETTAWIRLIESLQGVPHI